MFARKADCVVLRKSFVQSMIFIAEYAQRPTLGATAATPVSQIQPGGTDIISGSRADIKLNGGRIMKSFCIQYL